MVHGNVKPIIEHAQEEAMQLCAIGIQGLVDRLERVTHAKLKAAAMRQFRLLAFRFGKGFMHRILARRALPLLCPAALWRP